MTYTPIQLEVIRVFGRKELTEGCIIQDTDDSTYVRYAFDDEYGFPIIVQLETKFKGQYDDIEMEDLQNEGEWKILGHIPHLEDVFRLARDRKMFYGIKGEYVKEKEFEYIEYLWFSNIDIGEKYIPYNPSIPLLEQPESVLIQLLNLFKKGQ